MHAADKTTHDAYLRHLLQRYATVEIKLNKEKSKMDIDEMIHLGHKLSKHGVCPYPAKVQGILHMPSPKNKAEILAFQGTVNYLAKFFPLLSDVM